MALYIDARCSRFSVQGSAFVLTAAAAGRLGSAYISFSFLRRLRSRLQEWKYVENILVFSLLNSCFLGVGGIAAPQNLHPKIEKKTLLLQADETIGNRLMNISF